MTHPHFLITAGNTREKIDRVRDWGNIFTGNTGLSIARALAPLGTVHLLTSNASHRAELSAEKNSAILASGFTTHAELKAAIECELKQHSLDAIFMTAAVADYQPAGAYEILQREMRDNGEEAWIVRNVQAEKVKSNYDQIAIAGRRTEKLVDLFRSAWNYNGLLVKFKLEVGIAPQKLIDLSQASRRASGADYLVANTLDMVQGPAAGAYLLSESGQEWIPRPELPARLARLVQQAESR